jgi:hypothetical protein
MVEAGQEPLGNQIADLGHVKALVDTVIDSADDWRDQVKSNRESVPA